MTGSQVKALLWFERSVTSPSTVGTTAALPLSMPMATWTTMICQYALQKPKATKQPINMKVPSTMVGFLPTTSDRYPHSRLVDSWASAKDEAKMPTYRPVCLASEGAPSWCDCSIGVLGGGVGKVWYRCVDWRRNVMARRPASMFRRVGMGSPA
ncbi:hypothetical protein HYQ46_007015 [Verticillium longisporum]|nr:hypothetical protein HYQ46_007015 [Verticillium longisporum]